MGLRLNFTKAVIYELPHTELFCSKCKHGESFSSPSFPKDAYICTAWCKSCTPDGCPSFIKKPCPLCKDTGLMLSRPVRMMGYTIGSNEDKNILDEQLVPCSCRHKERL